MDHARRIRARLAGVLLVAALVAVGTVASGVAPAEAADPIGQVSIMARGMSEPTGITTGPDGALWFTNSSGNTIGRITTGGGVSFYSGPGVSSPQGIVSGPDGALWFTNNGNNSIGRMTTAGTVSNYTGSGITTPTAITAGPDGALWFTNYYGGTIGRITTAGVVSYFTDTGIASPNGITTGPDGALWFTNQGNNSIGRITTAGTVSIFSAAGISFPGGIVTGPDGALWFTNPGNSTLGRITTSGAVSSYSDPGISGPREIVTGPDGALWFTNGNSSLGRITTAGTVSNVNDPTINGPRGIASGPDGALWFTNAGSIGKAATTGAVTTFIGNGISGPNEITAGPDGALWFTNQGNNSIGRITSAGVVSNFTGTGISSPQGIASGPDAALWFTNFDNNSIGRVTTAGAVSNFTGAGISGPREITTGSDGALWFTNSSNDSIGRITTAGVVSNFTGTGISSPQGIASGPDGALWFTNFGNNSVSRITTSGALSNYTGTGMSSPVRITAGPDGALWFTNLFNGSIGRITTAGAISTFSTAGMSPGSITAGPDGALWFTNLFNPVIGRITTSGTVSGFGNAEVVNPIGITAAPDGNMWFAAGGLIGRAGTATAAPGAPVGVTGVAGDARVSVSWVPPVSDGGSPVTGYVVATYQGGVVQPSRTCLATPPATTCDVTGLTNGTPYTFTVTAINAIGPSAESVMSSPVTPLGAGTSGDLFHPLDTPTRILDSRPPPEQVGPYSSPWAAGTVRDVPVLGVGGVPANATAVTLNVTVTGTSAASFLTLWPKGASQPTASNLNWSAGQTIPNAVTVKVGAEGKVSVFNPSGAVNVIVDVVGYYAPASTSAVPVFSAVNGLASDAGTGRAAGGAAITTVTTSVTPVGPPGDGFTAQTPVRVLDSRPPPEQHGPYSTPWGPGVDRDVTVVGGTTGVPVDADAIVANVTVTGTTAESFLTVYPAGAPARPTASSLNWRAGQTIPNAVTVKVGIGGKIRVFNNSGNANVIIDVVGYFKAGTGDAFHPLDPVRFTDSRPPPDNVGAYTTPWGPTTTRTVAVTTRAAVPTGAKAVLANMTVTGAAAESFLTVWNTGAPAQPTASNLNFTAGTTIANAVTTRVGTGDSISIYNNSGAVNVIADAAGWYG